MSDSRGSPLAKLADVIDSRRGADPATSYVARLFSQGEEAILRKVGEEAIETILAARGDSPERVIAETADLWFHCLVMLSQHGLRPEQVLAELERRAGTSGIEEKARRKDAPGRSG